MRGVPIQYTYANDRKRLWAVVAVVAVDLARDEEYNRQPRTKLLTNLNVAL